MVSLRLDLAAGALGDAFSRRMRAGRAELFRSTFQLTSATRLLDLGAWNGQHIRRVLEGSAVRPGNVYLADIDEGPLNAAAAAFGYNAVRLQEMGSLPFEDGFFDVVFCSSVIEHVTVPKQEAWSVRSGREFARRATEHQQSFAREIRRIARGYWVQTPARSFVLESHSWMPFLGWLPRRLQVPILRYAGPFWPKQTIPDWHLLRRRNMAALFPGAEIRSERAFGMVKSWIAVKTG